MIDKLKRSEIDKNFNLKNNILLFLEINSLKLDWISNFKQIIYHYINDIKKIPTCYCGKLNNFKSSKVGYRKTCSFLCSNRSEIKKNKISETKVLKYGDENYNNTKKTKETKLEKYGDENYNNREKAFNTNIERYGYHSPILNKEILEKVKKTKLEKYGDENYNNADKIKEFWLTVDKLHVENMVSKVKETKLEKYGDGNYNNIEKCIKTKFEKYNMFFNNVDKMLKTKIERKLIFNSSEEWLKYKNLVKSVTRKNKKSLYENWDGTDYYDGENLKSYLSHTHTHRFYPTIDHKISVYYGFKNSIDPSIIGSIDNLCITKRFINSTKSKLIEDEFTNYRKSF